MKCRKCNEKKPTSEFTLKRSNATGYNTICKACEALWKKEYYTHPENRAKRLAYQRAHQKAHRSRPIVTERLANRPDKYGLKTNARLQVHRAIQKGDLVRPDECGACHKECKPEGHHSDYNKPLMVEWLCATCHGKEHTKEAQIGQSH